MTNLLSIFRMNMKSVGETRNDADKASKIKEEVEKSYIPNEVVKRVLSSALNTVSLTEDLETLTDLSKDAFKYAFQSLSCQYGIKYKQNIKQAQQWQLLSCIFAVIGFLLLGAGVVASILTKINIIPVISSAIPQAVTILFLNQLKTVNKRIDSDYDKLMEINKTIVAVKIIDGLKDSETKNRILTEVIQKLV